jgi:hypothetical protein
MILGSSTFLGLAVSDRSISIAEVAGAGAKRAVRKVMTFTLPAGVTLDQPAPAGQALRAFLRENGFTASRAVVGVPAKWLIARENDVPPAAPDQIHAMLSLAAERLSAAESSDLVTDFAGKIDGGAATSTGPRRVLLVAMLRQRLEQLTQLAEAAGLSVAAVTSSALVLAQTARQAGHDLPMLLLGRQGAEMVFQHAGTPRMLRHVSVVAMNGHGVATGPLGAELRRAVALAPATPNGTSKTGGNGSPPAAPGAPPTERELLLWDAVGLTDQQLGELSERMGVRVRSGQSLRSLGVQTAPEGSDADTPGGQFAPAVSLAFAGADRALLPIDFKRSRLAPRKKRRQMASLTSWGIILGALVVIGVVGLYIYVSNLESRLKVLDSTLVETKPKWDEARADRERLDYGLGFFEKRSPMLEALREVTTAFPQEEQIWVTNFTIREEKDQRKAKYVRRGMLIGKSPSQKTASDVSDRLRQNPKFADVSLTFQDTGGRSREVAFTIAFTFTATE